MNIPHITTEGAVIAMVDLSARGLPFEILDGIPTRCLWVLWLFMVGQERNVWKN